MRSARIKEPGPAYYHVVSRVVDRRKIFDSKEKELFRTLMRAVEAFSGVQVLTYAVMGNHWHIELFVPEPRELTDEEFIHRVRHLYGASVVKNLAAELQQRRTQGQHEAAEELKARYTYRMCDLSEFCKTLKQRFSQSYNRRHGRKGTLWEERFKSVLLQGAQGVLSTVAAYIDLNAVRAGLVPDPKVYRFCGYGEALGGSRQAREGIRAVMGAAGHELDWPQAAQAYRRRLYVSGVAHGPDPLGGPGRAGFDPQAVEAVLAADGALSLAELLQCRVRYFTDGVALGTREYVEQVLSRHRAHLAPHRHRPNAPCPMRGPAWDGLCTARPLRLQPVTPPADK